MSPMRGHPRERDWEQICAANWEPFIFPGYTSNWEQVQIVEEAIAELRRKFADFDGFNPLMLAVAKGFVPDLNETTAARYIEAVYCFAKFSEYCAPHRRERSLGAAAAPTISTVQ